MKTIYCFLLCGSMLLAGCGGDSSDDTAGDPATQLIGTWNLTRAVVEGPWFCDPMIFGSGYTEQLVIRADNTAVRTTPYEASTGLWAVSETTLTVIDPAHSETHAYPYTLWGDFFTYTDSISNVWMFVRQ